MTLLARVGVLVGCSHAGAHVPSPPCLGGPALSHPGVIAGLWGVGFPLPLGGVVLRLELLCLCRAFWLGGPECFMCPLQFSLVWQMIGGGSVAAERS